MRKINKVLSLIFVFITALNIECLHGQSHFSLVFEINDTLRAQSLIVRTDSENIVVVQDMFVTGPLTYGNRILRTTVFDHQGQIEETFLLDSTLYQLTQMIRRQTVMRTANAWVVMADQTYGFGSDPQSAQVWLINPSTWEHQVINFQQQEFVSVSGALLPGPTSPDAYCFYTSVDNSNEQQYLHAVLLRDDGTVLFNNPLPLPNTFIWEYNNVNSAVRNNDEIVVVLSYLVFTPNFAQQFMAIRMTLEGVFLGSEEYVLPILGTFLPRAEQLLGDTLHRVILSEDLPSTCITASTFDSPTSALYQTCLDDSLQAPYIITDGIQDENGRFYFIGATDELYSRSFIAHVNSDGTPLWVKQYFCDYLDNDNRSALHSIDLLEDDRLAVFGVVVNNPTSVYSLTQEWLFTLGRDGCYNGTCGDTIMVASQTLGATAATSKNGFNLYPNPARETVTFQYDEPLPDGTRLSFYTPDGRLVTEQEIQSDGSLTIPVSTPAGMLFWMLQSPSGVLGSGKLVLEK